MMILMSLQQEVLLLIMKLLGLLLSETILDQSDQSVLDTLIPASVQSYVTDEARSVLQSFVLDLNTKSLILSFSETEHVYSFNITELTLQN